LRVLIALGGVVLVTYVAYRVIPVNATTVGFAYLLLILIVASTWGFLEAALASLQKLGGADVILATAPSGAAIGSLLPGLKTRGKLAVVGVSGDAIPVNGVPLIFGGRSVVGSLTGRAIETQDTLDFSVLTDVRPMIETLPLAKAEEAYKRMMDGKARFRVVLTMS
jgi:propanol-preferring alcohol dehydrogenase